MKHYISIIIPCLLSIFLISCVTIRTPEKLEPKQEWEYGKLVFMGGECVAWFSPDLNIIGSADMQEYFNKNRIEPMENKVLSHFSSLGWEVVGKTQKDQYTIEYELKREKMNNSVSE